MHVEKYEKSAVGHMLRHYNRTAQNIGNREIDSSRTCLNYNLCDHGKSDFEFYRKRLSEVKCQRRKDVKTLCDWIVTLPKLDFTKPGEKVFFNTAYQELCRRYGERNAVSAWVHKDEAGQPHLHFCFIPVVLDKKKGIEKVSAKEVLTRSELRSIHKDMSKVMTECFGRDIGILNGVTVGANRSIAELKLQKVQEEVARARQSVEALEALKGQSIIDIARTIKKRPQLLSDVTRAVKISMGEEVEPIQREATKERGRCR